MTRVEDVVFLFFCVCAGHSHYVYAVSTFTQREWVLPVPVKMVAVTPERTTSTGR
mgnify:CR=1 FL=1